MWLFSAINLRSLREKTKILIHAKHSFKLSRRVPSVHLWSISGVLSCHSAQTQKDWSRTQGQLLWQLWISHSPSHLLVSVFWRFQTLDVHQTEIGSVLYSGCPWLVMCEGVENLDLTFATSKSHCHDPVVTKNRGLRTCTPCFFFWFFWDSSVRFHLSLCGNCFLRSNWA